MLLRIAVGTILCLYSVIAFAQGKTTSESSSPRFQIKLDSAQGLSSMRCAYCHDNFLPNEIGCGVCKDCSTPYHASCFAEHGSCSIMGCGGRNFVLLDTKGQPIVQKAIEELKKSEERVVYGGEELISYTKGVETGQLLAQISRATDSVEIKTSQRKVEKNLKYALYDFDSNHSLFIRLAALPVLVPASFIIFSYLDKAPLLSLFLAAPMIAAIPHIWKKDPWNPADRIHREGRSEIFLEGILTGARSAGLSLHIGGSGKFADQIKYLREFTSRISADRLRVICLGGKK